MTTATNSSLHAVIQVFDGEEGVVRHSVYGKDIGFAFYGQGGGLKNLDSAEGCKSAFFVTTSSSSSASTIRDKGLTGDIVGWVYL